MTTDLRAQLQATLGNGYTLERELGASPRAVSLYRQVAAVRVADGGVTASALLDAALRAKRAARAAAAATPIAEKLRIRERLRERDRAIKRAVAGAAPLPTRDTSA
ncbi:MAG: hypothetical protein IPP90_06470 [Gemmatimonadaceae bacterium]|nr:hypothetical protein [Gemmatimonadaceae bacterium]